MEGFREGMASGSVANFERQAFAEDKLLTQSDVCFIDRFVVMGLEKRDPLN